MVNEVKRGGGGLPTSHYGARRGGVQKVLKICYKMRFPNHLSTHPLQISFLHVGGGMKDKVEIFLRMRQEPHMAAAAAVAASEEEDRVPFFLYTFLAPSGSSRFEFFFFFSLLG